MVIFLAYRVSRGLDVRLRLAARVASKFLFDLLIQSDIGSGVFPTSGLKPGRATSAGPL